MKNEIESIQKLKKENEELKNSKEKHIELRQNGWYRITFAKAEKEGAIIPTASQIKIATKWGNQAPMTCIFNVLTAHTKASITEVAKLQYYNTNKHIDKIRIQYDENTKTFYIDIHYTLTNLLNELFTSIISSDTFWMLSDTNEVTEYTTVAELNL